MYKKNGEKTINRLQDLQLKHWYNSVRHGKIHFKDPETGIVRELDKPLVRADGGGLSFTLSVNGTASWILRYRTGGRMKELTLGGYPAMALSAARVEARAKRVEVDKLGDPAADRRREKARAMAEWSVAQLIADYRAKILKELGGSTQKGYGRSLSKIERRLGSLAVTQVSPAEIVELIESTKVPWNEARMLLTTGRMLFKHATGRKLVQFNPCAGVDLEAVLGKRPTVRRRLMLSRDELRLIFNANMNRENALAVRLLLATAVRTNELRTAKWADFNFDTGVWSVPASKTGPGIQIPITKPVESWLRELKPWAGTSEFVLPVRGDYKNSTTKGDRPINPNTIGAALTFWQAEYKPAVRPFTPHDFRSTAKSQMSALGVPSNISEMCLNHKLTGVEGIYDVHTYFDERKKALTTWADFLFAIDNERGAEVKS